MNDNHFLCQSSFRFLITVITIGFLLQVVACSGSNKPTPIVNVFVGELLVSPSGAVPPRTEVNIGINVRNVSPTFLWYAESGDNDILKGQGTSSIIYRAPRYPGTYEVRVNVKYHNESVERSISIIVEPPTPTPTYTLTPLPPTSTDTPTLPPTNTLTPTRVDTPTPTATFIPSPTPTPTVTPLPPPIPTLTPLPAPTLAAPENGAHVNGTFPPLDWHWDGELGENEYFEVRVWHENITTYRPALGWVKVPHFDYNITQELQGKYYWTVLVVEGQDARTKDWWRPEAFPYPVWDGKLVRELGPEGELRFFFYVPPPDICKNCGSPISKPCPFPPCE